MKNIKELEMPKATLKAFIANRGNFSILVLGERGSGKTSLIKELVSQKEDKDKLIQASCASFSEELAESELFGHKKGAFTGATMDHKGLFEEADKGTLLLDEIHHLNDRVRAKLLTALQTESSGENQGAFPYRPVGSIKTKHSRFQPIFASNRPIHELRKQTELIDFYDRIAQLVVEIPPTRNFSEKSKIIAFEEIWERMDFQHDSPSSNKEFKEWFTQLRLMGNFRDVEIIAILWDTYYLSQRPPLSSEDIFKHVKSDFEHFHGQHTEPSISDVDWTQPIKNLEQDLRYQYACEIMKTQDYKKADQGSKVGNTGVTKKTIQKYYKEGSQSSHA